MRLNLIKLTTNNILIKKHFLNNKKPNQYPQDQEQSQLKNLMHKLLKLTTESYMIKKA